MSSNRRAGYSPPIDRLPSGMIVSGAQKGSDGRGLRQQQEDTMNLIIRHDLASRSTSALGDLLRHTFDALARSAPQSRERRNALASIENIQAELGTRPDGP